MTIGNENASRSGVTIRGEGYALPLGRLERWMRDHVSGFRGPLDAERFEGGQSNPTYKLVAATGTYVLRRKPFGHLLPSAHAVDREYRVMRSLAHTAVDGNATPREKESIITEGNHASAQRRVVRRPDRGSQARS